MFESAILEGSYKGLRILIRNSVVNGGRKDSKKEFPNRDTQIIEDLGLRPRSFTLDIIISASSTETGAPLDEFTYFRNRDRLLQTLEEGGPGVLIHPFYGTINNAVARSFSITENLDRFGDTVVNVVFDISVGTGIPTQIITDLSQVAQANDDVDTNIQSDVATNYGVTNSFSGNFEDSQDKLNNVAVRVEESTSFLGATTDKINEFNAQLGEFSTDINSLVQEPLELSIQISNLFSNINTIFGSVDNTFQAFRNLFGFGDSDENEINPTTAGLQQRKNNRAVINGAINASALGYAYLNAVQLDLPTVRDIDETSKILEDQYQLVVNSGSDESVKSELTDMRVIVQKVFDEQKVTAKRIIKVRTNRTSSRLLSFSYYGNSDESDEIIELNGVTEPNFMQGDFEITTS